MLKIQWSISNDSITVDRQANTFSELQLEARTPETEGYDALDMVQGQGQASPTACRSGAIPGSNLAKTICMTESYPGMTES